MNSSKSVRREIVLFLALMLCLPSGMLGQQSGSSGAGGAARTAEQAYKNIQVLKGVPAEQIPVTMRLITASLGVQCNFCHVQGANEKDDKPEKQTAREMMQMVLAVNREHFDGRTAITCNSCHRGSTAPVGTPVADEMGRIIRRGAVPEGVTAEQLLAKYLQAAGSEASLAKISTLVAKGKLESAANPPSPVEIYAKYPDHRLVVTNISGDKSSEATGGPAGWTSSSARGIRDMTAADNEAIKLEDPLYLAANVRKIYQQWRVGRSEKIGERDVFVLNGTAPGHLPIRLYLDQQSGVLVRLTHFTETPLGRLPTQIDYSDYRDVGGVKVPFRIAAVRPTARNTIQLDSVEHNVSVEDSLFAKPAPSAR